MAAQLFVISDSSEEDEVPVVTEAAPHTTKNELGDEMTPRPSNLADTITNTPQIKLRLLEKPTTLAPLRKRYSIDHETEKPKRHKMNTEADALINKAAELLSFALEANIQELIEKNEEESLQNTVSEISQETSRRNIRVYTGDGIKILVQQNELPQNIITTPGLQNHSLWYQETQITNIETKEPNTHAQTVVPAKQDAARLETSCKLSSKPSHEQDKDQRETTKSNSTHTEPKTKTGTLQSPLQLGLNVPNQNDQPSSSAIEPNSLQEKPSEAVCEHRKTPGIIVHNVTTIVQRPANKGGQSRQPSPRLRERNNCQQAKSTTETTEQRKYEESEATCSMVRAILSPNSNAIESIQYKQSHEENFDQQKRKTRRIETAQQISLGIDTTATRDIADTSSQSVNASPSSNEQQNQQEIRSDMNILTSKATKVDDITSETPIIANNATSSSPLHMQDLPSQGPRQDTARKGTSTTVKIPLTSLNLSKKARWLPLSQEQTFHGAITTKGTGPAPIIVQRLDQPMQSGASVTMPLTTTSNDTTHQITVLDNVPIIESSSTLSTIRSEQHQLQRKGSPLVQTSILEYQSILSPKYSDYQDLQTAVTLRRNAEQQPTITALPTILQKSATPSKMLHSQQTQQHLMSQVKTMPGTTQSFIMPESRFKVPSQNSLQQQNPFRIEEHRMEVKNVHDQSRQLSQWTYEHDQHQQVAGTSRQESLEMRTPGANVPFTAQSSPIRQSHALIRNLAGVTKRKTAKQKRLPNVAPSRKLQPKAAPSVEKHSSIPENLMKFSVQSYPDPKFLLQSNIGQAIEITAADAPSSSQNTSVGSNQSKVSSPVLNGKGPQQPESFTDQSDASPPLSQPLQENPLSVESNSQIPQKDIEQLPTTFENVLTTIRDLSQKDPRSPKPAAQRPIVLKEIKWSDYAERKILATKIYSPNSRDTTNLYLQENILNQNELDEVGNRNEKNLGSMSNSCAKENNNRPTVIQNSPMIAKPTSSREEAEQALRYRLNLCAKDIMVNHSKIQERFENARNMNVHLHQAYQKLKQSVNNYCERLIDNATASTSK